MGLLILASLRALLVLTAMGVSLQAQDRPNILYIFTDDQSYRFISCYPDAYPFIKTPNIDKLAETGIRFDQAYTGAKCVPSRATSMTGRLQWAVHPGHPETIDEAYFRNQAYYEQNPGVQPLPRHRLTHYPEDLRRAGYYTGFIGKWAFSKWAGGEFRHGVDWDWSVQWDRDIEGNYWNYFWDQKVRINGSEPVDLLGYSTDRYTDYTVAFIEERARNPEQPWYMFLNYGAVHAPSHPPKRHEGIYDDEPAPEIPPGVFGPRPSKPVHYQDMSRWVLEADGTITNKGKTLEYWVKLYTRCGIAIDEGVGRIVEALEQTGQLDNTIIVFTSDNGYVLGHHGMRGKIEHYVDAIKVPFIVSNPRRFPQGKVVAKAPINGPDIYRTFVEWAQATPTDPMPGRVMTPLLREPESEDVIEAWNQVHTMMTYTDKDLYDPWEMVRRLKHKEWGRLILGGKPRQEEGEPALGIHDNHDSYVPMYITTLDGTYKYTRYINPDRIEELYNLEADPLELDNLAIQPARKDKLLQMRAECLRAVKIHGGGPFAELLPEPKMAY